MRQARWALIVVLLLCLRGPEMTARTVAAPLAPQAVGVYTEDFSTYVHKDYAADTVWDIRAHALWLAGLDGVRQVFPVLATDGQGHAVVVWEDYRNGNWDIYAQRVDAAGNYLWAADLRVNSDSGTAGQYDPAIAVDGNGDAIVLWEDRRNGNYDIYAQRLDAGGNHLWAVDLRVDSDTGTAWRLQPAAAVDDGGNAIAVWEDYRNGNWDIYAQRLDAAGNRLWAADMLVNSDTGTTYQGSPAVAVDGSGNAIATWEDGRNGNPDIYAQRLDGSGNRLWAADLRVDSDGGTAFRRCPAVAADANGNAVVVWGDDRNGTSDIYAQRLDAAGNHLWAADPRVNSDSGTAGQQYPAIAVDGSGKAVVVWRDYRNGNGDIYAQQLDTAGNHLWTADLRVDSDTGTNDQDLPVAAADGDGGAIVVWRDYRNGNDDIYAQRVGAAGNRLWAVDLRVNSDSGTAAQYFPAAMVDGSGNAMVVWQDSRGANGDIYAQRLGGAGNRLWASDLRVNSDSGTAQQWLPAAAVGSSGNAVMVWQDYRNGNPDIYAQRLDAAGNRLWVVDSRVNSDSASTGQWYPAVAVTSSGNAVMVWEDYRNGNPDIYVQRLDAAGNRLWTADLRVNSDSGTAGQWYPAVAVDGSENAVVVWEDYRNGNFDIYAQRLDAAGNRLWATDLCVNSDSGTTERYDPAVVVDSIGNAVVVWQDYRDGNPSIYAQRLDVAGNRLWAADLRLNSDTGTAYQFYPAVAVDGGGNAVVVWEDYRNSGGMENPDIYAQRVNVAGNRLWAADVRVNSDTGTAGQGSPAVAMDGSGNAIVVWGDYRNGNDDIYAQKLNQVGGKGWQADLQIVYPDLFYYPTGSAQSRTVDTTPLLISDANVAAGVETNGGSVQFYLTNDGGAHWAQVTPGVTHVFTATGSDLRWKATLTGDPIWRQRSPVVTGLRIEYSTQTPGGDTYEPDDTCAQARPIAVNGAPQQHSFHQPGDSDWAWFQAEAGHTYVLQTAHTGPNADTVLELYNACSQPPTQSDDNAFGPGSLITFQAPASGVYYAKVSQHDPAVYGEGTGYELSVRAQSPAPIVAIVAGRNDQDELQANITFMGDQAYRTFRRLGVPRENLRYLSVGANRDADQDGHLDVDGAPTWADVRYAVQDWPWERGVRLGVPFYLYLVDHGGTDYYCASGCAQGFWVRAEELNLWLSNLEATTGLDEVNVVLEACYSGSFIDVTGYGPAAISAPRRVVIASTGSRVRSFASGRGGYFSDAFFTALGDSADLWTAYVAGRGAVQAAWTEQTPWLDDNGDATADGSDGQVARGRGLAAFGGGSIPVVDWVQVGPVSLTGQALVRVQARDDVAVVSVQAEVYRPGFAVPDTGEGETPVLPVERLTLYDGNGDGVYEGVYGGFTAQGTYRLVAYAWDNDGNLSLPRETMVGQRVYLPLVLR